MSLDPGLVRVVDRTPIGETLLALVTNWQLRELGRVSADATWLQLGCSYETADGDAMDLAVPTSDVDVGDVIDIEAVPIIGLHFGDDMMRPPAQQAFAQVLQRTETGWRAEG